MTADTFTVYAAYCDVCNWESDTYYETASEAEREVERHLDGNQRCAEDYDDAPHLTPRQEYQQTLGRLAAEAIANART